MNYYSGRFADVELAFNFKHPGTACYYKDTLTASFPRQDAISVPEKEVTDWMKRWNVTDYAYGEYALSCSFACDALMRNSRIVFHGAAFLWNGSAWIFTAPSGTGKTTQLRLWTALFPDEVTILNGDKPILEITENGVMVHPSPWKGKEDYGRDDITVPLKGIIILQQADHNSIVRVEEAKAARNLFCRSYSSFSTEEEVLNTAGITESIVSSVPVWLLRNKGDEDSAQLTYHTLRKETGK